MDAYHTLRTSCDSHRKYVCLGLVAVFFCLLTLYFLRAQVTDTQCKCIEDVLICIPHVDQAGWHPFGRISRFNYATLPAKTIIVDNDDFRLLDLHAFERNVLLHASALQHLVIQESRVTYIPNLESNSKLLHFNASHNRIERVSAFEFSGTNLFELDLSFNRITFIHENAFDVRPRNISTTSNLVKIYLNNNRLTRAQPEWFRNLHNLKRVDLRNNFIAEIGLVFLMNLKALNHRFENFIASADGLLDRCNQTNDVVLV